MVGVSLQIFHDSALTRSLIMKVHMHLEVFTQLFVTGAGDKCHQLENLGGRIVLQFTVLVRHFKKS